MLTRIRSSGSAPGAVSRSKRPHHAGDDELVGLDVVLGVGLGEGAVLLDHGSPGAAARIAAEGLAASAYELDHRGETVLLHEAEMLSEALVAREAVLGAADRPEQDQALHHLRIGHREGRDRAAAHAAAPSAVHGEKGSTKKVYTQS
jgi:hypothetical protein